MAYRAPALNKQPTSKNHELILEKKSAAERNVQAIEV
jgi:hypothetical protein